MKKGISLFIVLIVVLISISCIQDDSFYKNGDISKLNTTRISLEDALTNADLFFYELSSPCTRIMTRKVKSIDILCETKLRTHTRSSNNYPDTLLYLINYDDNMGFALLGADKRLRDIYAISDTGSFLLADTLENRGLSIYLDRIKGYITNNLNFSTTRNIDEDDIKRTLVEHQSPRLTSKIKWGQDTPYNKYCFTGDGKQAMVGCVAVAVGQLLSCYAYPSSIDNYSFHWRKIKHTGDKDAEARLLSLLGVPSRLNMDYGIFSSGAYSERVIPTLQSLGYTGGTMCSLDISILKDFIYNGGVVYTRGYATNSNGRYSDGHAWIIDGYIRYKLEKKGANGQYQLLGYEDYLLHCNWGWKGIADGYYYWGTDHSEFNTILGPMEQDWIDKNSTYGGYNFKYMIEMVYGYKKPKTH